MRHSAPYHEDDSLVKFGPEVAKRIEEVHGKSLDAIMEEYICLVESSRLEIAGSCDMKFRSGDGGDGAFGYVSSCAYTSTNTVLMIGVFAYLQFLM